jgi:hypothetical protein
MWNWVWNFEISLLQENVVFFLRQKVVACDTWHMAHDMWQAHDMCQVNFMVSSITIYSMWCLLWHKLS